MLKTFQKILYGMKSLMIIYTSKQRGYSQQTERANGIVCCKRFFLLYKFKSKEIVDMARDEVFICTSWIERRYRNQIEFGIGLMYLVYHRN
jgi:hypothetical protein